MGHGLSSREADICGLVAKGLSNDQIAKLLFLTEGTVKNYITCIFEKTGVRNRAQLAAVYVAEYAQAETEMPGQPGGASPYARDCPKLRLDCAGQGAPRGLPEAIALAFAGREFVIGRFDVSVGRKQCDFEFGMATKAVSRRHAAVERTASGYAVVDLGSRAGTFVNGKKLAPGEPRAVRSGDRVSFGGAGADYVFEG